MKISPTSPLESFIFHLTPTNSVSLHLILSHRSSPKSISLWCEQAQSISNILKMAQATKNNASAVPGDNTLGSGVDSVPASPLTTHENGSAVDQGQRRDTYQTIRRRRAMRRLSPLCENVRLSSTRFDSAANGLSVASQDTTKALAPTGLRAEPRIHKAAPLSPVVSDLFSLARSTALEHRPSL
jgi:hypothetical protein